MRLTLALILSLTAAPAFADEAGAPAPSPAQGTEPPVAGVPDDGNPDEILVVATRLRGQVDAPQPPVVTLNEEDIQA